jgi:hypothetical protein
MCYNSMGNAWIYQLCCVCRLTVISALICVWLEYVVCIHILSVCFNDYFYMNKWHELNDVTVNCVRYACI